MCALIFRRGDCIKCLPEKRDTVRRLVASTSRSLVSSRLTLPAKAGPLRLEAMAGTGETDSVAEGRRFEPSVPPSEGVRFF